MVGACFLISARVKSRRLRIDLLIRYFRPKNADRAPFSEVFRGRGATGQWTRGITRIFFNLDIKIDWDEGYNQSTIDRMAGQIDIKLYVLLMKPTGKNIQMEPAWNLDRSLIGE